jgi:Glycosyltransferase
MRVLMMGPWAIERPRHGGQIRADAIVKAYRSHGHEVMFIGVVDGAAVPRADMGPHDLAIDDSIHDFIRRSGLPWQISLWRALAEIPEQLAHFARLVRQFRPDIVEMEEPYLWRVVQALQRAELLNGARIVHSAYNFETDYRRELARITGSVHENILMDVAETEREIASMADLVVAVSDADAESFRKIGAATVTVARNGCREIQPEPDALQAVDAYFGHKPFALFVSSAHPPNAQGLLDLAPPLRARLPGQLAVCGSVCELLEEHRRSSAMLRHARFMGTIDFDLLDALLTRAAVVLLPKTKGGGSNLKTSEALLSYRPVVATSKAFVGFEQWRDVPGVTVSDEAADFWDQVCWHLANPATTSDTWRNGRHGLSWADCLLPMVQAVERLASNTPSRSLSVTALAPGVEVG